MSYNLGTRMRVKVAGKARDKGARRILRKQAMKLARTRKRVNEIGEAKVVTDENRQTIDGQLLLLQEERVQSPPEKIRGGTWGRKSRQP